MKKQFFHPLLLCVLGVLAVTLYLGAYFLSRKQEALYQEIGKVSLVVKHQQTTLEDLQTMTSEIFSLFKQLPKEGRSRRALGEFFQTLVAKHHFLSFQFAVLPEEVVFKGGRAKVQKVPIRLHFATRLDDNVFEFLKDLHRLFPGITLAHDLSLEKATVTEAEMLKNGASVILKGTYLFDWYVLAPL